jgi:CPA2 family monovalent cation:H+ antiporter-2
VLNESELSHQAANESLPLRDAFAVLFFVSVGMLFDPMIVVRETWALLATLLIIVVGKSLASFAIVRAFGHSTGTALMISASLAQIGEFSFILAGLGVTLGLMPATGRALILGGAILSIFLNPLAFALSERLRTRLKLREGVAPAGGRSLALVLPTIELADHAVVVGYGRVGSLVGAALAEAGRPFAVIEERDGLVASLRQAGVPAILGNGAAAAAIEAANLKQARWLVVAIPNAFEAGQIVAQARAANPQLEIVARAHFDAEVEHLRGLGANTVIMGEREIARAMIGHILPAPASL